MQPAAGEHPGPAAARPARPRAADGERLRPGGRHQHAVGVPHQRRGQPVGLGGVGERPAALVAVPFLVDLRVLAGQPPRDPAAPVVGALPAAGRAVLADARRGDQVERPGPEPVGGAGERADRADLHRVAGEVGVERLVGGRRRPARCGPRSSSSMNGSPAICSENRVHRAQWTQRSRSSSTSVEIAIGLAKVRFGPWNRVSPWPLDIAWFCSGHSPPLSQIGQSSGWLISSSSITPRCAFSATGEVSWVLHHHALGAGGGAGGERLALALDLDQALPAGADRVEQRVVAEPRDLDAEQLGGPDDQRALGHGDLEAVDGDGHARRPAGSTAPVAGGVARSSGGLHREQRRCGRVERAAAVRAGARGTRPGST